MSYDENSFLQGIAVGRAMKGVSYAKETYTPSGVRGIATAAYHLYSIRNIAVSVANHIAEIPAVRGVVSAVAAITGRIEKAVIVSDTVSPANVTGIASVECYIEGRQNVSVSAIGTAEAEQTRQSASAAWEIEGRQNKNVSVSGTVKPVNVIGTAGVAWEYVEV